MTVEAMFLLNAGQRLEVSPSMLPAKIGESVTLSVDLQIGRGRTAATGFTREFQCSEALEKALGGGEFHRIGPFWLYDTPWRGDVFKVELAFILRGYQVKHGVWGTVGEVLVTPASAEGGARKCRIGVDVDTPRTQRRHKSAHTSATG